MNYRATHNHYAFAAVALWSSSYPLTRIIAPYFSAPALGLVRCLMASVVLAAVMSGQGLMRPVRSDLRRFILPGLTGFSLYLIFFNQGQSTLGPTASCIIISTSPIITALMARALFGERLSWLRWLAIGIAFCGILVMTLWDGILTVNQGFFWVQAAAISISCYHILQRRLAGLTGPMQATAYSCFTGAVPLLFFVPAAIHQIALAPGWATAMALYMGVFPTAAGYLCWIKALGLAEKTSQVANYMFLTPFLALLLECAIIAQAPDAGALFGGGIILAGLALFSIAGRRALPKGAS
ncbi:MAG: DMT family transporter [Planctomycetes bacterium]|nr:DMT family transporter [Planctomycetota bacterium]